MQSGQKLEGATRIQDGCNRIAANPAKQKNPLLKEQAIDTAVIQPVGEENVMQKTKKESEENDILTTNNGGTKRCAY